MRTDRHNLTDGAKPLHVYSKVEHCLLLGSCALFLTTAWVASRTNCQRVVTPDGDLDDDALTKQLAMRDNTILTG